MELSTFKIVWAILLAGSIVFFAYGKTCRLRDLGEEMTELQVNNPMSPDLDAIKRKFRFWDRTPSLVMIAMALGTMIVTQL